MIKYAIPVLIGNLVQQIYNFADTIIVGQCLGNRTLAAVGNTGSMFFLVNGFVIGITSGFSVHIAQCFGAKDYDRMRNSVCNAIMLWSGITLFITLLSVLITKPVLRLINTPDGIFDMSYNYIVIIFAGIAAPMLYNAVSCILRALGDSKTPLYYLIFSSVVNVVFDLIFVGPLKMGVAGAALATVISQAVSAVMCFAKLLRATGPERVVFKKIRFDMPMLRQIAGQGIPSGIQNSIISIANVVVQSNINAFGADAMAGCGSYSKVEGFVFLPITAFTAAITTFIGQNLGAGEHERAKRGARFGIFCAMALAELFGVVLYFICPAVIRIFNDDPAVVSIGVSQMRTECFFFFALAFAHGVSAVMRGAGRARMPMFTMLACWCILRVTYITLAVKAFPVIETIFWAYPITWCTSCVVFLIYYLKADWVHTFDRGV